MGKRVGWYSAIKRVFFPHSKDKLANESDKKGTKEKKKKKKGLARLRHLETNSFIPFFREPSSIEKILGEAEREHNLIFRPPSPPEQPETPVFVPARAASPRVPSQRILFPRDASLKPVSPTAAPPRSASPRSASPCLISPTVASPRAASPKNVSCHKEICHRPEPTVRNHHASATRIQAAYRGFVVRRSFRALKGLVRLQGVLRGQNVKRQTVNAMKYMQRLVRVQSQIQSQRIQMLENQVRRQAQHRNDKEVESTLGKWSQSSEAGNNEDWDDSLLTKEEIQARMQRKVEAVVKRERAMAYSYSHQLWKATSKSTPSGLTDIRSIGFPSWWNWLERQLPSANPPDSQALKSTFNFQLTPPRPHSELKPRPGPASNTRKQHNFEFDNMDTPTPRSSKSAAFMSSGPVRTPVHRNSQANSPNLFKYSRARASGAESPLGLPLKDDDSLISCPPFSVPNYMSPTVAATAKVRTSSNPKERFPGTPPGSEKRRLLFPLSPGIGSLKWNKGSVSKDSSSQKVSDKHYSPQSIGNLSVDSTVSMPATVGRKPFNRFV